MRSSLQGRAESSLTRPRVLLLQASGSDAGKPRRRRRAPPHRARPTRPWSPTPVSGSLSGHKCQPASPLSSPRGGSGKVRLGCPGASAPCGPAQGPQSPVSGLSNPEPALLPRGSSPGWSFTKETYRMHMPASGQDMRPPHPRKDTPQKAGPRIAQVEGDLEESREGFLEEAIPRLGHSHLEQKRCMSRPLTPLTAPRSTGRSHPNQMHFQPPGRPSQIPFRTLSSQKPPDA